jgi:hypothetical protein
VNCSFAGDSRDLRKSGKLPGGRPNLLIGQSIVNREKRREKPLFGQWTFYLPDKGTQVLERNKGREWDLVPAAWMRCLAAGGGVEPLHHLIREVRTVDGVEHWRLVLFEHQR